MSEVSITLVDVLVAVVLLTSAGLAAWRGLVHETFTIVDWVVAGFVALRFTPTFQPLLQDVISPSWLEYGVVFVGTFLLMFIPLSILNHRLSAAVRKSEIGPIDRALGGVFGLGRGLVVVGVAYVAFSAMVPPKSQPTTLTHAKLYPVLVQTGDILKTLVPGEGVLAAKGETRTAAQKPAVEKTQVSRSAVSPPARNDAADAKTYGANDRRALDKLIETMGGQDSTR